MFNGKIHYKWPFSIAMSNYQRVASSEPFLAVEIPHAHPFTDESHNVEVESLQPCSVRVLEAK